MCQLLETIKVLDGKLCSIHLHNERLNDARKMLLGQKNEWDLRNLIDIPAACQKGLFKCRVLYGREIDLIEFMPYSLPKISRLKLVADDEITYEYKFASRTRLEELRKKRGLCDEIIIVRKGRLTDTSFTNVAFWDGVKWITPAAPLLRGTKRRKLLEEGVIFEEEVTPAELRLFKHAALINAMLDLDSIPPVPVENIELR